MSQHHGCCLSNIASITQFTWFVSSLSGEDATYTILPPPPPNFKYGLVRHTFPLGVRQKPIRHRSPGGVNIQLWLLQDRTVCVTDFNTSAPLAFKVVVVECSKKAILDHGSTFQVFCCQFFFSFFFQNVPNINLSETKCLTAKFQTVNMKRYRKTL